MSELKSNGVYYSVDKDELLIFIEFDGLDNWFHGDWPVAFIYPDYGNINIKNLIYLGKL